MPDETACYDETRDQLRRYLVLILSLTMIGTVADLLLLGHYEGAWQWPPLALIAVALPLALGFAFWPTTARAATLRALRATMTAFVVAGLAGVFLHFQGNSEFQREIDPDVEGWPLVVKVMTAKAPPALAPGVMVYMGLLGLLYAYRHPALKDSDSSAQEDKEGARP